MPGAGKRKGFVGWLPQASGEPARRWGLPTPASALLTLDLASLFLFALQGASTAAAAGLDLVGVLVVGFVTGLGGGILRDILIGDTPPPGISNWRYGVCALVATSTVFLASRYVREIPSSVIVTLDACALALFAVAGCLKCLDRGTSGFTAALMGMVSTIGGGIARDVLLDRIPRILMSDIYATAALVGTTLLVFGLRMGLPRRPLAVFCAVLIFGIRMVTYRYQINLPTLNP